MFHTNNKELRDFVNNIVEFNINGHVAENLFTSYKRNLLLSLS
jgi:UDP-galactopyranose mutase